MKKYILLSIICLMAISVNLQAQRPHHGGKKHGGKQQIEKMKADLELTDEQVTQFEEMNKSLRAEMMEVKKSESLSMDEKHAKMKELGDKKKGMMDKILTPEQKTKMEAHHAERKAKREEYKEERKARHEEKKAFHEEKVMPFMMEKRAELDKDIKKKDRKQIDKLRAVAMAEKEKMKQQHEEMRAKHEKGEEGGKPHHGKRGKGHHRKGGKDKMFMMKMMKEHEAEFKQAEALADKYADEIDAIMADVKVQMDEWKAERKEEHKGEGREGKPQHRKGQKGEKGGECKKGGENCDKSAKKSQTAEERKEMRKKMKRIGFLLMPTEKDAVENRETIATMESKIYPNPAVNSNTIELNIVEKGKYTIILFNESGQEIKVVNNAKLDEGTHRFTTDLSNLPTGIYYYSITNGKTKSTQKFVKN